MYLQTELDDFYYGVVATQKITASSKTHWLPLATVLNAGSTDLHISLSRPTIFFRDFLRVYYITCTIDKYHLPLINIFAFVSNNVCAVNGDFNLRVHKGDS